MSREVRRVPINFNWPLNKVWEGFLNPHMAQTCYACDGSGYNPETRVLSDAWYDHDHAEQQLRWCNNITQDEVQALVDHHRLIDFTHTWEAGKGWIPKDPPIIPTAAEVNEWSRHGMGHDAINHGICVETRAKRLGVWGLCPICNGDGHVWSSPEVKAASEAWKPTDPPTGDAYQIWEMVSEGSPISPPFVFPEELAWWMVEQGHDTSVTRGTTYEQWLKFIRGPGWAPTLVCRPGVGVTSGVAALAEDNG